MAQRTVRPTTQSPTVVGLDPEVAAALRARLAEVADSAVLHIVEEVPSYAGAWSGRMGEVIRNAVQLALGGFLTLATRQDADAPRAPAIEGAYQLGRGEARSGRTVEALLSAYRIGARASWREMAETAVAAGVDSGQLARFAELVFAYIDELSAASVAGHTDELESTGRVRQRNLERLARALLTGAPADAVNAAAERADWEPPGALTAVVLPESQVSHALTALDPQTLQPTDDVPGLPEGHASLLVPSAASATARRTLLRALRGTDAVVGPSTRGWRWRGSHRARCGARPWASRAWSTPTTTSPRSCSPPTPRPRPTCAPRARAARRPAPLDRREAHRHPPQLAAPPRPPRRGRRGALRPRADRALPRRPAPGGLRRPARRPRLRARRDARAGLSGPPPPRPPL